jgi:hypothetical protein
VAAAPPYVSYSTMTEAVVSAADWPFVYASLQAHKAHTQEYPGCQHLEAFVAEDEEGGMRIHCYTIWDTPEQLEAFLARGYTFERMLIDVAEIVAEPPLVMEKVF